MPLRVGYNYLFSIINNAQLLCTMHFSFGWTLDGLLFLGFILGTKSVLA